MARTHKKSGDDAVNRLTGAAAHEHERATGANPHGTAVTPGRTDVTQLDPDQFPGSADPDAPADRYPYPRSAEGDGFGRLADMPTAAIGRAVVPPPAAAPLVPYPPAAASIEPPPIESYEELLGGLGERPFDSPRPVTPEAAWGRSLRRFARTLVWTLPVAAICFALSGMWGWPTWTAEPAGESPGTWLVVTVFGLILGVVGVLAMTALLSSTPGRRWSLAALISAVTGTVLLAPILGVVGLARPSVTRVTDRLGPDAAADLERRFFDNAISRWLGVGGLVLLAVGWLAFGCAVLASGALNRVDGYLALCAVAIAVVGAYLSWQFLITVAAMVLLAAGLGLSWTASRLTPDGRTPVDP